MTELPSTFEQEQARAVGRLASQPLILRLGPVGVLALSVGAAAWIPWPIVRLVAFFALGLPALALWRRTARERQKLTDTVAATSGAELWFRRPDTGLVFFDARGIFVEREGCLFEYAPTARRARTLEWEAQTIETRLASVSYEGREHALKVQLTRHEIESRSRERLQSVWIPLPAQVAPEHALKLAVEANRKAARAS